MLINELGKNLRLRKLTKEELSMVRRINFVDFLNDIKEKIPSAIVDLLVFSGPLNAKELTYRENWIFYKSIYDIMDEEVIRILSLRFLNSKTFQEFFFEKFLKLYPNAKKCMDLCVENELTEENFASLNINMKALEQVRKIASRLDNDEASFLAVYSSYIDVEQKYIFRILAEDYENVLDRLEKNDLYIEDMYQFYDVLESLEVEEKLLEDEEYWEKTIWAYSAQRIKALQEHYGKDLRELLKNQFLLPEKDVPAELNISHLLHRHGYPDNAFFSEKELRQYWNEDALLGIAHAYYKTKFCNKLVSFNKKDEFKDTSITKYTIKKYIFPNEDDFNPSIELNEIFNYFVMDYMLQIIGCLSANIFKKVSEEICNNTFSKDASRKLEQLENKAVSLQELSDYYEKENVKLKKQLQENKNKDKKDKSFLEDNVETNKKLQQEICEKEKRIEKLEQKLQQYEEYLQATENNDISISEQSVDNETLEKWYADKKLMFFTHEAGEYINSLKKEFPDCTIVDNETQALDGVKADITVAMTKSMSHKLFFKQKSFAAATGAKIVYFNQRNIEGLKRDIYFQIAN